MNNEDTNFKNWILTSAICGLLACINYTLISIPVLAFPKLLTYVLAFSFGPLLSVASMGLYQILKQQNKTVSLQIATVFNVLAGMIVTLMLVVQSSIREYATIYKNQIVENSEKEMFNWIFKEVNSVQLGLDVSWDIFISIGTFLFALNMFSHPQFGKIFSFSGMIIATFLLVFNLLTFPVPPADAGLIDFGPFVGLWYLVVSVQVFRIWKWQP